MNKDTALNKIMSCNRMSGNEFLGYKDACEIIDFIEQQDTEIARLKSVIANLEDDKFLDDFHPADFEEQRKMAELGRLALEANTKEYYGCMKTFDDGRCKCEVSVYGCRLYGFCKTRAELKGAEPDAHL